MSTKVYLLSNVLLSLILVLKAQENKYEPDSIKREVPRQEYPVELLKYINEDNLKSRAALLVFNESLRPLGRYEFYDTGALVRYKNIPIRMNRCALIYIDTGLHLFHTMYQQIKEPVYFGAGKVYMARLFSRPAWPIGGVSVIKKNVEGKEEEYAAVLFEYINSSQTNGLLSKMKKRKCWLMND